MKETVERLLLNMGALAGWTPATMLVLACEFIEQQGKIEEFKCFLDYAIKTQLEMNSGN